MRAIVFTGAGGNEVIRLEERPDPRPGSGDVLVRVRHAALNPADAQQRDGNYPAPPGVPADIPGLEVSGVVEACGDQVIDWKPGDRVFGLVAGGGLADRVVVHERCVAGIPDALDDLDAAAVPEAFITAHDAIAVQAALRPGETLLVHGAAGGVGTAAIQIGRLMGARVLGTWRSEAARDVIEELGAEPIADEGFTDAVLERTGGADVILELVGAPHFAANVEALALKGRMVIVGVGAGDESAVSLRRLMQKRATVRGTVLRARPLEEKGTVVRAFAREVVPAFADRRLRAVVDSVFGIDDHIAAFERLEGRGKVGKVLLDFGS